MNLEELPDLNHLVSPTPWTVLKRPKGHQGTPVCTVRPAFLLWMLYVGLRATPSHLSGRILSVLGCIISTEHPPPSVSPSHTGLTQAPKKKSVVLP